ncbi:serine threonine-protein kinase prp4 protein [Apiospora marii]|uniref:serine threonine-protein kinase prp4 protein n=1 Tax=Apiospora marii TaxID=335849 RepID=UPI0031311454
MGSPASSDEGEILENGVGNSKATSLPQTDGIGVDRQDRNRRAQPLSRGYKRSRNDRDYQPAGRVNADPRRFRVHYEDERDDARRSRLPYDDDDRPPSRSLTTGLRYDDSDRPRARDRRRDRSRERDSYPEKRPRNRTRSPYRPPRGGGDRDERARRDGDRPSRPVENGRGNKYGHQGSPRHVQNGVMSKRATSVETTGTSKHDTKSAKGHPGDHEYARASASQVAHEPEEIQAEPVLDEEEELERRRRRRAELLAKTSGPSPMLLQAVQASEKAAAAASPAHTQASTPLVTEPNTPRSVMSSPASPGRAMQEGMSPAALDIATDQDLINTHGKTRDVEDDGPSAADYDPTADMREDEMRDELRNGNIGPHGEVLPPEEKAEIAPKEEPQAPPAQDPGDDDDDLDMFAEDFDEDKFAAPKPDAQLDVSADDRELPGALAEPNQGGILEGDDKDGYYKIRIGEIMNGRYQVQSTLGKGMFSGVARAVDITTKNSVAIKMMRNNDALRKGGYVEIAILEKLNEADPENRKHIVKFERHFEHKGHLCLAFENLSLNLREVLRKFGNNVGINLPATRAYAHQMFVALAHMRKCTIIHADIKPDNILVNESRNVLKICDLGTAIDRSDAATAHNEITPYLVSRFYRAPEIILGMPYDYSVDMWSIGCTLYELYTGKILFTGDSNNQMLKAIMEIRGKFSAKLFKRGQLSHLHFDDMGNFVSVEHDKTLGKTTVRTMAIVKPTRDLRTRLMAASGGMNDVESRELNQFVDLLERCLALNPDKRITPLEALKHPFFTTKMVMPVR